MSKLPSSKQIIKTLTKNGFIFVSQRGSHAKFKKGNKICPPSADGIYSPTANGICAARGIVPRQGFAVWAEG